MLQCNYVRQAIDLLEGLIPRRDDNKDVPRDHLEKLIVFAIMWSLGALLEQTDRKKVLVNSRVIMFDYITFEILSVCRQIITKNLICT